MRHLILVDTKTDTAFPGWCNHLRSVLSSHFPDNAMLLECRNHSRLSSIANYHYNLTF